MCVGSIFKEPGKRNRQVAIECRVMSKLLTQKCVCVVQSKKLEKVRKKATDWKWQQQKKKPIKITGFFSSERERESSQ